MNFTPKHRLSLTTSALCFGLLLLSSPSAQAGSVSDFAGPNVTKNQLDIEYNGTRTDDEGENHNSQAHELATAYGITDVFAIGGGIQFADSRGDSFHTDGIFAEATYQFTDQEDGYWLSSAILGEYGYSLSGDADALEASLLLQHESEQFDTIINLVVGRETGEDSSEDLSLESRVSSRYKLHNHFNPGIEWHSAWGSNRDIPGISEQEHFIGPAAYGELFPLGSSAIGYEVAYVFGITDASEDGVLRVKLEYGLHF